MLDKERRVSTCDVCQVQTRDSVLRLTDVYEMLETPELSRAGEGPGGFAALSRAEFLLRLLMPACLASPGWQGLWEVVPQMLELPQEPGRVVRSERQAPGGVSLRTTLTRQVRLPSGLLNRLPPPWAAHRLHLPAAAAPGQPPSTHALNSHNPLRRRGL